MLQKVSRHTRAERLAVKPISAHGIAIGLERLTCNPSKLDEAFLMAQHCRRPSLQRHSYGVPIGNAERNTLGQSKRWNGRPCKCTRAAHSSGPKRGFYLSKPSISQTRCPGTSFVNSRNSHCFAHQFVEDASKPRRECPI